MRYIKIGAIGLTVLVMLCCWTIPTFAEVGFGFKGGMMIPDQEPFSDEFDSEMLLGGVLELDSNLGLVLEASAEYYAQDSSDSALGGDIKIYPIVLSVKYNFFPRYRTTPFVGIGAGAFFFDRDFADGTSTTKTRFGARLSCGIRFLEDRRMNLVIEGARNFVDFDGTNASSFQVTGGFMFDFYPTVIGAP